MPLKPIAGLRKCGPLLILSGLLLCASPTRAQKIEDSDEAKVSRLSPEAAATFNRRCTACHTYGRGVKIGPDLKGINERHSREWLIRFIGASSKLIKSGDPVAISLFTQFQQQRMPDWTDLTDQQIGDILDYIAVGGPDIKPADERNAEFATAAEANQGRQLFLGETRFRYGAHACANCHTVSGIGLRGGTLGPDLSNVYTNFQDRALTEFFRHSCFTMAVSSPAEYLSAHESFALKAFLRQTALQQSAASNSKLAAHVILTTSSEHGDNPASPSSKRASKGEQR